MHAMGMCGACTLCKVRGALWRDSDSVAIGSSRDMIGKWLSEAHAARSKCAVVRWSDVLCGLLLAHPGTFWSSSTPL